MPKNGVRDFVKPRRPYKVNAFTTKVKGGHLKLTKHNMASYCKISNLSLQLHEVKSHNQQV